MYSRKDLSGAQLDALAIYRHTQCETMEEPLSSLLVASSDLHGISVGFTASLDCIHDTHLKVTA